MRLWQLGVLVATGGLLGACGTTATSTTTTTTLSAAQLVRSARSALLAASAYRFDGDVAVAGALGGQAPAGAGSMFASSFTFSGAASERPTQRFALTLNARGLALSMIETPSALYLRLPSVAPTSVTTTQWYEVPRTTLTSSLASGQLSHAEANALGSAFANRTVGTVRRGAELCHVVSLALPTSAFLRSVGAINPEASSQLQSQLAALASHLSATATLCGTSTIEVHELLTGTHGLRVTMATTVDLLPRGGVSITPVAGAPRRPRAR